MEKKVIISAVVVIVVIFVAYLILTTVKNKESGLKLVYEEQVNLCLARNQEDYNSIMAVKTSDLRYCEKVENKEYCLAKIRGDIGICDVGSAEEVNDCKAYISGDTSWCSADNYYCLAYTTGEVNYCSGIEETEREECIVQATLNAEYYVSEERTRHCEDEGYFALAFVTKETSYCEKMINQVAREACLSER